MGLVKDDMIWVQERGYGHSDKRVCASCFGDRFLQKHIRANGEYGYCSFCRRHSGTPRYGRVMFLENFMPVIMNAIRKDYDYAASVLPWDSETKSYFGNVLDPVDFVFYELNEEMLCENEDVLQAIVDILEFEDRASLADFRKKQEDLDMDQWRNYCRLVRKSSLTAEQIADECFSSEASEDLQKIRSSLEMVYSYLKSLHMTEIIHTEKDIFRCVDHIDADCISENNAAEIPASLVGTAPPNRAEANRMSEKGDMMFYGAFEKETALREARKGNQKCITTGIFHTNKRFRVLNLCTLDINKLPSIFDAERAKQRSSWFFINELIQEISAPVRVENESKNKNGNTGAKIEENKDINDINAGAETGKNKDIHKEEDTNSDTKSEYKPTQVFAKFIQRKTSLSGILYPSSFGDEQGCRSQAKGSECLALFVPNEDCINENDKTNRRRHQLIMQASPEQERV